MPEPEKEIVVQQAAPQMPRRIRLRNEWVRIAVDPAVEKTRGGIWIPEVARNAVARGTVVAVGPGRLEEEGEWDGDTFISKGLTRWRPVDVKVGDRVLFHPQSTGMDEEFDGENLKIVGEWDIFGVIEGSSLIPCHDRLLIRPDKPKQPSDLIWLPHEVGSARWNTGTLVAIGPGMKVCGSGFVRYGSDVYKYYGPQDERGYNRYAMPDVALGKRVIYVMWATNQLEITGRKYHCVRDTQILAELIDDPS
jgi:chaperonin GroES